MSVFGYITLAYSIVYAGCRFKLGAKRRARAARVFIAANPAAKALVKNLSGFLGASELHYKLR